MILTLILAADASDADRAVNKAPWPSVAWVGGVMPADPARWLAARGSSVGIHVIRTDRWRYDVRTIDALRRLAALVTLVDPCGLLGVETSTTQTGEIRAARVITDGTTIGKDPTGAYRRPMPRRAQQPTRTHNG